MDYNDLQIQQFYARFEEKIAFLDALMARVTDGELVPLDTLDRDIDTLCKEVESADSAVAREVQPVMALMINRLDELVQALDAYKEKLMTED